MKKITLGLLLCCFALQGIAAEEATWLTDLPKAEAEAKKDGKLVLMDFSGSDWCPGCIKLHDEVFTTPEFAEYAKKNLTLVSVDFPHNKEQSEELKSTNKALREKYAIEGLPTVILANADGKKIGQMLGYDAGTGPKAFIAELEKLKAKK